MSKRPTPVHNRDHAGRFAATSHTKPEINIKDYRIANPELQRAMHGLRSSSAAQPHDTRPNRRRTRATSRQAAITDSSS